MTIAETRTAAEQLRVDANQISAQLELLASQADGVIRQYDEPGAIKDAQRAQYLARRAAQLLKDAHARQHNPHRRKE